MKKENDVLCKLVRKYRASVFPPIFLEKAGEAIRDGDYKYARLALECVLETEPHNRKAKELLSAIPQ